ncbi:MAG: N-methyl-L-tryptophan oxidase [Nocardioides sp.]
MAEFFEYIVVGLGGLGSGTAYELAKRGHRVLGLEQFKLGHHRGASHDTSRILRHSYHTPSYVELTQEAYRDWAALETDSGESLVTVTGGLDLFPPGGVIPMVDYTSSLTAVGIDHLTLDADEIISRWPQFRVPEQTVGLFQPRGAIVPAGRGTAVMQQRAAAYGAVLRDQSPVTSLRDLGGHGMEVNVGDTAYVCRRLVLCADAWTNQLLVGLGVSIPLTVTLEQVTYFAPPDIRRYAPGRLPLWIWMDEPSYYGFPSYGEATIKAAEDCGGPISHPDARTFQVDLDMQTRLASHVAALLPGSGPPVRSVRCLYTLTPDRDLLIDAVPGHPAVYLGLGAAHGFKFAPTIGRLLADLAVDGKAGFDLTAYSFDRPGLTDPDYEPTWMV